MSAIIKGAGGNKLRRYFVTALLLSLAVTGGLFAYAYTIASTSLLATDATADFANVTANTTDVPTFKVFGSYRGKIPAGSLFTVEVDGSYTGDIGVNVYLDNIDDLSYKYSMLMVRVRFVDNTGASYDVQGINKVLSLRNGVVTFVSENLTDSADDKGYIEITGGIYRAFPWAFLSSGGSSGSYAPSFTAEIFQAGL